MKVFTKNSCISKIALVIVVILLISFVLPTHQVQASDIGTTIGSIIAKILCWLGDSVIRISQKIVLGTEHSFIECDLSTSAWAWIAAIAAAIVVIAVAVVVSVCTCGAGAAAIAGAVIGAIASSAGTAITVGAVVFVAVSVSLPDDVNIPLFSLSPEAIFSNRIGLTDVNFFNPIEVKELHDDDGKLIGYYIDENGNNKLDEAVTVPKGNGSFEIEQEGEPLTTRSTASILREAVSTWYFTIRNLALIGLLSVLVYIGIRIVISSAASEKAKYKNMIGDWLTAIILVFILQYIMAFAVTVVQDISKAIHRSSPAITTVAIANEDLIDKLSESDIQEDIYETYGINIADNIEGEYFIWPTNFLGQARLSYQYLGETDDETVTTNIGYAIIYCVLVFFTIYYLVVYIKRAIYIAFLTMIAPLITLTYPIDKLNDGQAQAFNVWLKEYMYNLLIQPFHLILYTVFVSSAMSLATDYPIYTIVVLGFMMPAEKLLRRMFNFNKAETTNQLSAAAGGALVGSALTRLGNMTKKLGSHGQNNRQNRLGNGQGGQNTPSYGGDSTLVDGMDGNDYLGGDDENPQFDGPDDNNPNGENDEYSIDYNLDGDTMLEDGSDYLGAATGATYGAAMADEDSDETSSNATDDNYYTPPDLPQEEEEILEELEKEDREQLPEPAEEQPQVPQAPIRRRPQRRLQQANNSRQWQIKDKPKPIKGKFKSFMGSYGIRTLSAVHNGVGNLAPKIFGAGVGLVTGLGGAVYELGSGNGISGMVKGSTLAGAAGYAVGTGTAYGVKNTIDRGAQGLMNSHDDYVRQRYGQDELSRRQQVKENRVKAAQYVADNHSDMDRTDKKELIKKLTDATVDSGTDDFKMADKAIELQEQGTFDSEEQVKSLLKMANQIKGRDAYSDETRKSVENMVNKKLVDKFIKDGMPEADAKKSAKKATKDYMKKLYKLL